jgi:allophanate hydrolase subunit 1
VGTTLALTATAQSGGTLGLVGSGIVGGTASGGWQIIGTADLTAAYAIFDNIDVSASVRYEQDSSASPAHLRYGAGLRYRF